MLGKVEHLVCVKVGDHLFSKICCEGQQKALIGNNCQITASIDKNCHIRMMKTLKTGTECFVTELFAFGMYNEISLVYAHP